VRIEWKKGGKDEEEEEEEKEEEEVRIGEGRFNKLLINKLKMGKRTLSSMKVQTFFFSSSSSSPSPLPILLLLPLLLLFFLLHLL
jgi:hypothetical protein